MTDWKLGHGWRPEAPDAQDLTHDHEHIVTHLTRIGLSRLLARKLLRRDEWRMPSKIDLQQWVPQPKFQGGFNTCNAHVVGALLQYFEQKAFGRSVEPSRLFLYKVTKNFLQEDGDPGVYIRQTMGTLKLIGVPPEKYWPYLEIGTLKNPNREDPRLEEEPTAFCYSLAADYQAISYYRLDQPDSTEDPDELLHRVKAHLLAQIPCTLGFPLYASIKQALEGGKVPYPAEGESQVGNHAVVAIGYDDDLVVTNADDASVTTKGALRILNSWSTEWGDEGFGWLPYEFVLRGRTQDYWTLVKSDWVDTGNFQIDL